MRQSTETEKEKLYLSSLKCSLRSRSELDEPFLRLRSTSDWLGPPSRGQLENGNEDAGADEDKDGHKDDERQLNQTPIVAGGETVGSNGVSLLQQRRQSGNARLKRGSVLRDNVASYFVNQAEVDWHSVSDLDGASKSSRSGEDADESASQQVVREELPVRRRSLVRFSETNSVVHLSPPPSSSNSSDDVCPEQERGMGVEAGA